MNRWIIWLVAVVVLSGCSDKLEDDKPMRPSATGDIPVLIGTSENVGTELQYAAYVFHKAPSDADYVFEQEILLQGDGTDKLKFANQDLVQYDYRFLFTATPLNRPEIVVTANNKAKLSGGENWTDVIVLAQEDSLTIDNYYDILDKTGKEILKEGSIDGVLTRLVGQVLFDFSKIGTDINNPVDITDATVTSVFDRVYQIDATYTGLSRSVGFGSDLTPRGIEQSLTVTRIIYPEMNAHFGVSIPQQNNGLDIAASGKKGSVRLYGACALPTSASVKVTLVFHYYDTTPVCENSHGDVPHIKSCYTQKELRLNLSDWDKSTGLTLLPDYYTLNRAGIHCNRIIDIATTTGLTLDAIWKNTIKTE